MRIVSGKYRGRAINPPKNLRARPTTDFAKENLFNVLGNLLRPEGIFIFEHSKKMDFSTCEEFWQLRSYGSVQFSFFKKP